MKNFKIALVDSGIGGLSLLKTLACNLKVRDYIYFADLKNIPYGNKKQEHLLCLTIKNVNYIIKNYKPNIIVFGCNTIGSSIFEDIKEIFPDQSFFAIKPELNNINSKSVVIATTATTQALVKSKDYICNKDNIVLCKMPRLALKVENYIQNGVNLVPYLKNKLKKFKSFETIILGCTHYYFVKELIKDILPKTQIIDGRLTVLKQIKNYLKNNKDFKSYLSKPKCNTKPKIKICWCLTGKQNNLIIYKKLANKILKK